MAEQSANYARTEGATSINDASKLGKYQPIGPAKTKKLEDARVKIEKLKKLDSDQRRQIAQMAGQRDIAREDQAQAEIAQKKVAEIKRALNEKDTRLREKEKAVNDSKIEVQRKDEHMESLKTSLENQKSELEDQKKQCEQVKEDFEQQKKELEDTKAKLEKKIASMQAARDLIGRLDRDAESLLHESR